MTRTHEMDRVRLLWYASSPGGWSADGTRRVDPVVYRPGTVMRTQTTGPETEYVLVAPPGVSLWSVNAVCVNKDQLEAA